MYVFSYGSNMAIRRLIDRGINPIATAGTAVLEHWQLSFNKKSYKNPECGFANIEPAWGQKVFGVVYGIKKEDVEKLDKFEGYPKHYQRTILRVKLINIDDAYYDCATYIANRKWTTSKKLNVNDDYKQHIINGINEHLIKDPIMESYVKSLNDMMM